MNKLTGNLVYLNLRFNGSKYLGNYGFSFEVILGTFFRRAFFALHFPNYFFKRPSLLSKLPVLQNYVLCCPDLLTFDNAFLQPTKGVIIFCEQPAVAEAWKEFLTKANSRVEPDVANSPFCYRVPSLSVKLVDEVWNFTFMPINFETQFNQTETRYLRTVGITVGFSNSDLDVCKFASRLIYSKVLVQLFLSMLMSECQVMSQVTSTLLLWHQIPTRANSTVQ